MSKPMSVATGGGGSSPRWTIRIRSSILGMSCPPDTTPRAALDGGGHCHAEKDEGRGHRGENSRQPPAEPVAGEPAARGRHEEADKSGRQRPAEASGPL